MQVYTYKTNQVIKSLHKIKRYIPIQTSQDKTHTHIYKTWLIMDRYVIKSFYIQ